MASFLTLCLVAPISVKAPVCVNVNNNARYCSRYCQCVYKNGTVCVNVEVTGAISHIIVNVYTTEACDDINAYP